MVNIIIPIWRARDTLPAALDSLVAQTLKRFAVTIVQDCDGEDYSDIREYYEKRLNLYWLNTPVNSGPGVARQLAIDASNMFDYLMFLDADDLYFPRAVEVAYKEAKKNSADIVAFDFMIEEKDHVARLVHSNEVPCTWCWHKIYRRDYLVEKNIRFDEKLRFNEDSYFNVVAWNSSDKIFRVDECIYLWRDNNNSLSREGGDKNFFYKGWEQYIESQVKGMHKLFEINEEVKPSLVAFTLCNIYDTYERALHYGIDMTHAQNLISQFKGLDGMQQAFTTEEFWNVIVGSVKCVDRKENDIYFYKERFIDWFKAYINRDLTI